MPGSFFREAHNIFVYGGSFPLTEIQYAPNFTFNVIVFPAIGGTPPATIIWRQVILVAVAAMSMGAGVAGLIVTPQGRKFSSNPPSLPPALPFYARYEFILEAIDEILQRSRTRKHISIRGGPGLGKTATATGIMHHPRIAQRFGNARHWVNCQQASDIPDDLKVSTLLEYISTTLNPDLTASSDHWNNIKYFLHNNDVPRIIVLDNFETMWEPSSTRKSSEEVLNFLAGFTQLTMILTTRIAHDPATNLGVSCRLDDLLRAVNCIPLPIVLAASSAQANYTTSELLETWDSGLVDDSDPMKILDHSISRSLQGPMVKSIPEAPVLLRIIADLPGGLRRENIQRIVPSLHKAQSAAAVLIQASLLTNSRGTLQMHSTIRSYMRRNHPLDAHHKEDVQKFYFQLIHEAGGDPGTHGFLERARSLYHEETNAQALLLDTLEHNFRGRSVFRESAPPHCPPLHTVRTVSLSYQSRRLYNFCSSTPVASDYSH